MLNNNIQEIHKNLLELSQHSKELQILAKSCAITIKHGGKIYLIGNGGSAADAQHIAAEFVVRLRKLREALPAVALSADTAILTAIGNDFNFKYIFSRQIEALCEEKDCLIALSTSGRSLNVVEAIKAADKKYIPTTLFTGKNDLSDLYDHHLQIFQLPGSSASRIQEMYMILLHTLVEMVEKEFEK